MGIRGTIRGLVLHMLRNVKFEKLVRDQMQMSVGDFGCRNLDLKGEI